MAVMFGGRPVTLTMLGIGLAIQPALSRIERNELSSFFQIAFGVSTTALLVVLLVELGPPIGGGLVLTAACCCLWRALHWYRAYTTSSTARSPPAPCGWQR
jgi:hypothetical protein